ncbi:hypothetical protein ANRL1_01683 [Anaerolineae bacterium]|nr:hypothetical protein ANRL1_01683 [Anaerolineae bacterium]
MKTRVLILLMFVLIALLSNVACRGREQAPVPAPAQPTMGQSQPQPTPAQNLVSPTSNQPTAQPPAGKAPTAAPTSPSSQADLVIADATVALTNNPNQVQIHIVARKQGNAAITAAFTIRWHPHQKDKTQVGCSQDFYNLTQTEWVVDCSYTYPANERGEMHWVAVVDAENDVKNESNENNNEKTGTITIASGGGQSPVPAGASYDLYVRRMDFMQPDPIVGQTIKLAVMIASDTRPSGAPYFPASYFRWRKGPSFAWQEESCPASTQYAQCTKTLEFSYTQPGDYAVEVEADNRKEIAESSETNNARSFTLTVKAQAGGQAPAAPTNCRTRVPTSGSVQIILDWDYSGQPAPSGFRIYQGTTSLEKTVGPNDKSATLSNLTRGVQYHFDVRAYNSAGESRANACSVDVTSPR